MLTALYFYKYLFLNCFFIIMLLNLGCLRIKRQEKNILNINLML